MKAFIALTLRSFSPEVISPDGVIRKPMYLYCLVVGILLFPNIKDFLMCLPFLLNIITFVLSTFRDSPLLLYYTILYYTIYILYDSIRYIHTIRIRYDTIRYDTIHTIRYDTYDTILYYTILYYTILYYTILYIYYTILYYTILYYIYFSKKNKFLRLRLLVLTSKLVLM